MDWENKVKEHYRKQAEEFGRSKQSTMKDMYIRDKEIQELILSIKKINTKFKSPPQILEIGCGNGYLAEEVEKVLANQITGIDFSEELLEISRSRGLKAKFVQGDATKLEFADNSFHIILTERCLINLESFEKQKRALDEIWRVLKPGGYYVMMEAFTDGWKNLNEAREVIGLDFIPQPHHNVFFEKEIIFPFLEEKFEINSGRYNFLSSYYFYSRVLYPSLILNRKEIVYNNKFLEFFSYMPPMGNYSSVQLFILHKK